MSESVEQAALRAASFPAASDWQGHARREAAMILDGIGAGYVQAFNRDTLVSLLGIAWLQGVNYGAHETLHAAEAALGLARDSL